MEFDRDEGAERADGLGSARASRAMPVRLGLSGASPESSAGVRYAKRRLPHFERPWAKYAVSLSTYRRHPLAPKERDLVLQSLRHGHEHRQYELYVACVMPDHVHLLFEPQIKDQSPIGGPTFWSLAEILHGIKSSTAHRLKIRGITGSVWERESFDRLIRSESDLHEKFSYICRNPWDSHVADQNQDYPWLWTQEMSSARAPKTAREGVCAAQASRAAQPRMVRFTF
jgi:REP element-mobilizing transposase RayT